LLVSTGSSWAGRGRIHQGAEGDVHIADGIEGYVRRVLRDDLRGRNVGYDDGAVRAPIRAVTTGGDGESSEVIRTSVERDSTAATATTLNWLA